MTFNDTLKYKLAVFSYPNRAAVLDHLFCVNGNGYEFDETGEMVERGGSSGSTLNELVAIEHWVGAGKHKKPIDDMEEIPKELRRHFLSITVPADIEERLDRVNYDHWYPMSVGYNSLEKLPDNIPADWLNAAWECANLIILTPLDINLEKEAKSTSYQFLDMPIFDKDGYKVIGREKNTPAEALKKARKSVIETRHRVFNIADQALKRMKEQFPNHKFERNPTPTFDATRKMPKQGIVPWPLDESPADIDLCIEPFKKALKFAYSMRRRNQTKDIPYHGLPLGRDERACSFSPEHRFVVEQMDYDKYDQGRDALEVILCCMAQICIEQGRRDAKKKIMEPLNRHFEMEKFRKIADERAKTDLVFAARLRIVDQMQAGEQITINDNDPNEVQALKELREGMARMTADLDVNA
jgi:hypothetical protein